MQQTPQLSPQNQNNKERIRTALKDGVIHCLKVAKHNWPWKILSLLLAITLWAGLIMQDPTLTREVVFPEAKVAITGADALRRSGYIALSQNDIHTVRMKADVPQRVYNEVTEAFYYPRVDLSRIDEEGEQTLRIQTNATTTYGEITSLTPETISVVVEKYVTNYRVPVTIERIGEYPEGYYGKEPTAYPSTVSVSGPESLVSQVSYANVPFDVSILPSRSGNNRHALSFSLCTAEGEPITSEMLEVTSTGVLQHSIIVEQELFATKMMHVNTENILKGKVKSGYEVKSIAISPSEVVVAGTEDTINKLESLYLQSSVDMANRSESFTTQIAIKKPEGITYMQPNYVTVSIEIAPLMKSVTYQNIRVDLLGGRGEYHYTLSDANVDITITGPKLSIDTLRSKNIDAFVNIPNDIEGETELVVPIDVQNTHEDAVNMTYKIQPDTVTLVVKK